MLCSLSSKAFSFWFLIAFSSLNNLRLAFQKLWLSEVLFLSWDPELILEVETEHCPHSPSGSVGAVQAEEEKKSMGICVLSCFLTLALQWH